MNHPWQQPIRPLEIHPFVADEDIWYPVLFIRPETDRGWEVITYGGTHWQCVSALLRTAD